VCNEAWRGKDGCRDYNRVVDLDNRIDSWEKGILDYENRIANNEKEYDDLSKPILNTIDINNAKYEYYWKIENPTEEQIKAMETLDSFIDKQVAKLDELAKTFEASADVNEKNIDTLIKLILDATVEQITIESKRDWIKRKTGRVDKRREHKEDRKARRDARKNKREEKKNVKQQLRDKYGKGKDYRTAKTQAKQEIKEEKKDTLNEHGGTFGRRFLKVFPASVVMRNAFLVVLKLNIFDIAGRLLLLYNNKDTDIKLADAWKNTSNNWFGFGGEPDSLLKAIKEGGTKPPIQIKFDKNYIEFSLSIRIQK
jgi:DNA polymerase III alpha subunit (gram-positive type)